MRVESFHLIEGWKEGSKVTVTFLKANRMIYDLVPLAQYIQPDFFADYFLTP